MNMQHRSPTARLLRLLLLVSLMAVASSQFQLFPGNYTINAATYYTVTILPTNVGAFDAAGWTIFTLPTDNYDSSQLVSAVCSLACPRTGNNFNCSNGLYVSNLLQFNITGIVNPPSAVSPLYSYNIFSSVGASTDSLSTTTITFTPGALTSCSMSFSPNFVRKVGVATLVVTPGNKIVQGGYIQVRFPKSWAYTVNNDTVINSSLITCSAVSGSISSSFLCALDTSSSVYTVVTATNIFSSNTTTAFSISISPVLSLPLSYSSSEVAVISMDANGNVIDNYTSCTCQAPSANTFTMTTITTTVVSKNFTPSLVFRSTDVINGNDSIRYTLPSEMSFVSTSLISMTINDTTTTSPLLAIESSNSNSTSNSYTIKPFSLNGKSYANSNVTVTIMNAVLMAPPSTKPSGNIVVSLYRNGAIYSTGTISITALTGTLTAVSIAADSLLVNAATSYNLSFTTASPLSSTGLITIQMPSTVTTTNYAAKSCQVSGGTNISASAMCQMSSGTLTVTNAFAGTFAAGSLLNVYFNGVTNPESSATTSSFRITTLYDSSNSYAVDYSNTLTFKASADTITSLLVSSASSVVGAASMYTVTYTLKNHLPVGGTVLFGLPLNMSLENPNSAAVSISIGGAASFSSTPSIVTASNGVYSSALNFSGLATSSALAAGTVVVFNISNIVNPSSTKPSNSFSMYSYLQNNLIESLTSGVTVTMNTTASFATASVASSSKMNGDATSLILSVMPSVSLPVNGILRLTLPSDVSLTSPSCSNLTTTPTTALTCSLSGNILSIQLSPTDPLSTSVVYKYQVSGFTNPRTMTTSGTFGLVCYSSDGFYKVAAATLTGITNTLPNYITSLTAQVINPVQSYVNSSQTILFTLTTKNALTSPDYILLSYPSTYTYISSTGSVCLEPTTTLNCTPQSNPFTIAITGTFVNQNSFTFRVQSYRSPELLQYVNSTNYFMVYTLQSNGNNIDITNTSLPATQVGFTISCDSNCKECATPITNCTSCYPGTITNNQYLQNSVCVSTCATGSYPDAANGACQPCASPCSTCTSATACLSCLTNVTEKYYNSANNSCLAVCPQGFYGSINVCTPCSSPCLNCSTTSTNCTACNTSLYVLYNSNCTTSCPTGTFNSSGTCLACDISCLTCTGLATNCTLCATGYVTNGTAGVCTNTCMIGTVPYNGACGCRVDCLTCSGTASNCTSCDPASAFYAYYYSNQCLGSCPNGTYDSSKTCIGCPFGCSTCTSATVCQSCNNTYYLYNSGCVTTCPAGTFASINVCSNCTSNCATCASLASNCTSCVTSYTLEGNVCKVNCSTGIPVSTTNGLVCTACTNNCSTCSVTLSNCTSCLVSSGTSLYNNACVASCPAGTTSVTQQCQSCVSPCLTCDITTSNCLTCRSGFYKVSQTSIVCVSDCSAVGLFISATDCTTCQSPCSTCSILASNCTSCVSGTYLLNNSCVTSCGGGFFGYQGACLTSCPAGTTPSNGTCVDSSSNGTNTTNNSTTSLNNTLTSSKIIPFPFFIADSVVIGLTLVSKFSSPETSIACMGTSVGSLLEFGSWAVVLVVVGLQQSHLYLFKRLLFTVESLTAKGVLCILIGLLIHYVLNIINFAFYLKYITNDEAYQRWLKTPSNSRIHKITLAFSLLFTHKFSGMPFSKCFGSSFFKAPLSKPHVFTPLSIVAGVSSIVSVLMIVGCAFIVYDSTTVAMSSVFIQAIDVIVVTAMLLLLGLWNLRKPEDFFDEHSKLNTTTEEIYNDTLAGMINNQSEFGERFSIDEAEEGALGKRNYSRVVKNESKLGKESKVGRLSGIRKRDSNDSILRANESQDALNIHDMSSEYVSDQSDPNEPNKMEEFTHGEGTAGKSQNKAGTAAAAGASNKGESSPMGISKNGTKKQEEPPKPKVQGSKEKSIGKSKLKRTIEASDNEDTKTKKSAKTKPMEVIQQSSNAEIEEEKSSSIIDKMRESSDFVVQDEQGLQAGNPVELGDKASKANDKSGRRQKSKQKSVDKSKEKSKAGDKSARTIEASKKQGAAGKVNPKEGSKSKESGLAREPSSSIFNKHNKIGPMELVPNDQKAKDAQQKREDDNSAAYSEQRLHDDNQIEWEAEKKPNQSSIESKKSRSKSKGKDGASKSKSPRRDEKSSRKLEKQKATETAMEASNQEEEKKEENFTQSDQERLANQKVGGITRDKAQERSMPSGLKERSVSPKKSNVSVKVKPKLKSDVEAGRSVREKSLIMNKTKKAELEPDEDEENDQMGSINLQDEIPTLPHHLQQESETDSYIGSRTLNGDQRGRKNRKQRKPAPNYEDLSSEHVFNALANTSLIKNLDAPDELPSKPKVMGKKHVIDTGDNPSNITNIDENFVNRFYVDDESLKSIDDGNVEFNDISPSEFNIQNQRYDDSVDFPVPGTIKPSNTSARPPLKPEKPGITISSNVNSREIGSNNIEGMVSYYDTVSYKDSELDGTNRHNLPKGLSPERRQLPPLEGSGLYDREADVYQSFSKLDSAGYDGVYQRVPEGSNAEVQQNRRKMRDLEKIYLQRLDFKNDNKRRSSNSAFNKKNFLDES